MDSAIATLFCDGVFNAHSMGIGGGFLMTIFIKETGEVVSLNAREKAPLASTLNMFDSDPHKAQVGNNLDCFGRFPRQDLFNGNFLF